MNKTGILLLCAVATAAWTWNSFLQTRDMSTVGPAITIGAFGGLIVAFVTIFKKAWSPVTAPIYALLEGLVLGGLSAIFELRYPGIALEAVGLTFGTLVRDAAGVQVRADQSDAEVPHRRGSGHRRHHALLLGHHAAQLLSHLLLQFCLRLRTHRHWV